MYIVVLIGLILQGPVERYGAGSSICLCPRVTLRFRSHPSFSTLAFATLPSVLTSPIMVLNAESSNAAHSYPPILIFRYAVTRACQVAVRYGKALPRLVIGEGRQGHGAMGMPMRHLRMYMG